MSKHTKGPWTIGKRAMDTIFSNDVAIADVFPNVFEGKANARLIAAAPELLEALKSLLFAASFATSDSPRASMAITEANQAIAKAEGED